MKKRNALVDTLQNTSDTEVIFELDDDSLVSERLEDREN
jgi:hypothetical protein